MKARFFVKNGPQKLSCSAARGVAALFVLLGLLWSTGTMQASASDIYIVDTIERPETEVLGKALAENCRSCGTIIYRQMAGSSRVARRIADELYEAEQSGRLAFVVTLGRPATQVIADKLKKTPVIYTFVGREIDRYRGSGRIRGLPTDAPLQVQIDLLAKLAPNATSAGIVLGQTQQPGLEGSIAGVMNLSINVYRINDYGELPDALRRAVKMNEALILLRDRMVINNDSIKFVMQQALENGRHTIAYSRSLVDMGLAAALLPKPEAFGRHIGASLEAHLSGETLTLEQVGDAGYFVHTNPRVLDRLQQRRRAVQLTTSGAIE